MSIRPIAICVLALVTAGTAQAQYVQVNRTNKTIQVSVTETVHVDPEIAELKLGYINYAKTKDVAYEENVRAANKIVQQLLDSGLPKETIETETLRLGRRSDRQMDEFEAQQEWIIRVPVAHAQDVADLAVRAGANILGDVQWTVADPQAVDAKAHAAALARARLLAQQISSQTGAKLGDLLFVSNQEARDPYQRVGRDFKTFFRFPRKKR